MTLRCYDTRSSVRLLFLHPWINANRSWNLVICYVINAFGHSNHVDPILLIETCRCNRDNAINPHMYNRVRTIESAELSPHGTIRLETLFGRCCPVHAVRSRQSKLMESGRYNPVRSKPIDAQSIWFSQWNLVYALLSMHSSRRDPSVLSLQPSQCHPVDIIQSLHGRWNLFEWVAASRRDWWSGTPHRASLPHKAIERCNKILMADCLPDSYDCIFQTSSRRWTNPRHEASTAQGHRTRALDNGHFCLRITEMISRWATPISLNRGHQKWPVVMVQRQGEQDREQMKNLFIG